MESVLEKRPTLTECREAVRNCEEVHRNLSKQLETLILGKSSLEQAIKKLEGEREDCIRGIPRGSRTDADLAKIRKHLDQSRDDLLDKIAINKVTKDALAEAARDLTQAKQNLDRELQRAWRGVVQEIRARYSPQIQEIFMKMNIALIASSPAGGAPLFHSISNTFDLKAPRTDLPASLAEWARIKSELEEEFGII